MVKLGIIGVGGIAGAHLSGYGKLGGVQIVALCDKIDERASGKTKNIAINIDTGGGTTVQARPYTDYHDLLADAEVEAVDICLPTDLHAEVAIAALEAGKHVLSEKPMALTVADCDRMVAAAKASGRILMIAQCVRFCPEYMVVKQLQESGTYGKVIGAFFRRLSGMPRWSSEHWMEDPARSGGGILDLHVHDVDFINYLLGLPKQVSARGREDQHGIGYVLAQYEYGDGVAVAAEGGWAFQGNFPFRATFVVRFEQATVEYDPSRGPLTIYQDGQEPVTPALPGGDLYTNEIAYFLQCVSTGTPPTTVTAWDARETIRLALAEAESVRTGKTITL